MGVLLYNSVLVNSIWMRNKNSKTNSQLQLKQYIAANFKCYLNAFSITNEIRHLCYAQMKANCPNIL